MTRDEAIKALTIQLEYWEQLKEKNVLTDHEGNNVVDVLKMAIEALTAEPVKHGEWKYIANEIIKNRHGTLGDIYGSPMFMNYECSECKFHIANDLKGITDHRTTYCPNCGAKMDGDSKVR